MRIIKNSLTILMVTVSLNLMSQKAFDFSFQLNSQEESKYQLEVRFARNEQLFVKHSLMIGYPESNYYKKLIGVNDSFGISRVYNSNGINLNYNLGSERIIKQTRFSFCLDWILGYSNLKETYFREYNPREDYYGKNNMPFSTIDNNSNAGINRHFLNTGLLLGINYTQPINDNISIFCGANVQSIASLQFGQREFNDYENLYGSNRIGFINTTPGLKLGLRFKF